MATVQKRELTPEEIAAAGRLKAAWESFKRTHDGATQSWLGSVTGLGNQSNIGQYLNAVIPLNLKALLAICGVIGINPTDISKELATSIPTQTERRNIITRMKDDVEIPQYDVGGGMGNGHLLLEDQPGLIKSWHVDHEWVRRNVKTHTGLQNLCIVTGFGPSMKPMYNPGDPLLVDTGVKTVDHEGVYFFRVGDEGYIKLIQRVPEFEGAGVIFRVISKNSDYPPYDISPKNPHFEVLGKVLTVWKSEQF